MAINIRPTTFSYEHLALAFLEYAKQEQRMRIKQARALDQDASHSVSDSEETSRYQLQLRAHSIKTHVAQSNLNSKATPFYQHTTDQLTTYMQSQKEELDMTQVHRSQHIIETTPTDPQKPIKFDPRGYPKTAHSRNYVTKHFPQTFFKSPQTCSPLPKDDPNVKEAVFYFEKSLEISDGLNQTAVYELGLLYRHIRSYDKSIEYFRNILRLKSSGHHIDQQLLVNAYEQIGLCYREMAEETEEETEKSKLRESGKIMLTKAIEECARQVAGKCKALASLPTLGAILTDDFQTTGNPENLKELGRLNMLVGKYKESLTFYQTKNPEIAVEHFIKLNDYQNVAVFLHILMCTEEGKAMANKSDLIHRLHAKAALYYMKKGDYLSCQGSFQSIFLYHFNCLAVDTDDMWDVVVLDDPGVASKEADWLKQQLQDVCGLQVTRNTDDALGGLLELHAQTGIIEKSKTVLIFIGNNEMSKSFVFNATLAVEMMTKSGKPSSVVVVALDTDSVPSCFGALPCKKYMDMEGGVNSKEGRGWLLELFQKLIGIK